MRTYAKASQKLLDDGDYPAVSLCITCEEFERCSFLCMQLDKEDSIPFLETDTPQGYNMVIMHPETNELGWAYSQDFDFFEL